MPAKRLALRSFVSVLDATAYASRAARPTFSTVPATASSSFPAHGATRPKSARPALTTRPILPIHLLEVERFDEIRRIKRRQIDHCHIVTSNTTSSPL